MNTLLTAAPIARRPRRRASWSAMIVLALIAGVATVVATPAGPGRAASGYQALSPERILDTRGSGAVGPGDVVEVPVTGRAGVPSSGVAAVVLNVTAVAPTADTWVTVWPTGQRRPEASNLNVPVGDARPNLVIATVGEGGRVSLYNDAGETHLLADVTGWFPAGADYGALSPERILDTRGSGAVGPGGVVEVPVTGRAGVPSSGVAAVVLNVTAADATEPTWATLWPTGQPRPEASNLNVPAGGAVPNAVIATVGDHGQVSLYNDTGSTHYIVDVTGWFAGVPTTTGPSGELYIDSIGGELMRYDFADRSDELVDHVDGTSMVFSPNGVWWTYLSEASGYDDAVIRRLADGAAVGTVPFGSTAQVTGVYPSPDGELFAGRAFTGLVQPGSLRVVDRSGNLVGGEVAEVAGFAWSDNGSLFVSRVTDAGGQIVELRPGTDEPIVHATFTDDDWRDLPSRLNASRDGSKVAYSYDDDLWVLPTTGGAPHRVATGSRDLGHSSFSPDGRHLAVAYREAAGLCSLVHVVADHRAATITIDDGSDSPTRLRTAAGDTLLACGDLHWN